MIYKRNLDYLQQNLIPLIKLKNTNFLYMIIESKKLVCLNIKDKF